jgi:hypothetical protein
MNVDMLVDYYNAHYNGKIFHTKLSIKDKNYAVMYTHNQIDEIKNFVEKFSKYFPFYVWNEDQLEVLSEDDIDSELNRASHICWDNNSLVPRRATKVNGIYGEVFLDFYERIIKRHKLVCTFAGKRSFKSNYEATGFDNVFYIIGDTGIEFVFSEAKFVTNSSTAKSDLIKDISGKDASSYGHLSKDFLNDYISFVVQKASYFSATERAQLKSLFSELNKVLVSGKKDFVQYLIDTNTKVNCVFFAIFQSTRTTPEQLADTYDSINREAKQKLDSMGIGTYSIEIVFVPIHNKSMEIKGAIDEHYK